MRMLVRHVFCHLPRSRIFTISTGWTSLIVEWKIGKVFRGANGVGLSIEKVSFFFSFFIYKIFSILFS